MLQAARVRAFVLLGRSMVTLIIDGLILNGIADVVRFAHHITLVQTFLLGEETTIDQAHKSTAFSRSLLSLLVDGMNRTRETSRK